MGRRIVGARRQSQKSLNHGRNPQALLTAAVVESLEQRQLLSVSFTVSSTALNAQSNDVELADINGDGKLDLVATQYNNTLANGTVTIQLGNGNGTFGSPTVLPDGLSNNAAAEVMVADFNGSPDLVLQDKSNVTVMLGNGSAIIGSIEGLSLPNGDQPRALAVGDFNGDGDVDLAVGDQNGDVIMFLGNGNGSFKAPTVISAGATGGVQNLIAANFNGDHNLDLAVGSKDGSLKVFLGNGNGSFAAAATNTFAVSTTLGFRTAAGDLTNDGKVDLVIAQANGTLDVLLGNGNGTFKAPLVTNLPGNFAGGFVRVSDISGDAKPDIIVSYPVGNKILILPGNGNGTFKTSQAVTLSNGPSIVALGDLTGNGLTDIVTNASATGVSTAFVLLNTSAPGFTSATSTTFTAGVGGTFFVATTGSTGTVMAESGTLPSGVAFIAGHNGTSTLKGVPINTAGGTYHITFTAETSATSSNFAVQDFTLTVDQTPKITSTNHFTFTTGSPKTFTAMASGFPAPTFTETGTLPTGVTFDSSTDQILGTPAYGQGGNYTVTLNAANTVNTAGVNQVFTVTVDQPPAITSAANNNTPAPFQTGQAGTFALTTTGFPAPKITETGTLPSGIQLTSSNGSGDLLGTPAATAGGNYLITLTATNGIAPPAVQIFTLNVEQPPVITSANHTTFLAGNTGSFLVTYSGTHVPVGFSTVYTLISPPSGLAIDGSSGLLSGVIPANTQGTYTYTFEVQVNNLLATKDQTFTLTVDQPPAFTGASTSTFTVGTISSVLVNTIGFPAPTVTETGTLPTGVTLKSNGTLSGTPATTTGGTYNILLTASNSIGKFTEPYALVVDGPPKFVSTNKAIFSVGNPGTFTILATGLGSGSTAYSLIGSGLTAFDNDNPGLGIHGNTIAGVATEAGTFNLTLSASNGIGVTNEAFTIIVVQD